jgi:hypothetical protein
MYRVSSQLDFGFHTVLGVWILVHQWPKKDGLPLLVGDVSYDRLLGVSVAGVQDLSYSHHETFGGKRLL